MRFNTDAKGNADLLPNGEYSFVVEGATEDTSSQGNDMIVLKLNIEANGKSRTITDYIISSNIKKIKRVSQALGIQDLFESGEIEPEALIGRKGKLRLVVEVSRNANFPDRNIVENYLVRR